VYMQVCTLHRCFHIIVHICVHTRCRVCTCALVCAVCSLALGDESGGVQLLYTRHFLLAYGVVFDKKIDRGVVCVLLIFGRGVGVHVCVCVCVYAHTHTHNACGLMCSKSVSQKWNEAIDNIQWYNMLLNFTL